MIMLVHLSRSEEESRIKLDFFPSKTCLGWKFLPPPWLTKSAEVNSIKKVWFKSIISFFFLQRERERKKNTAQWTLSWQTLKELTGPNKSPSERLVSDKVKVIKRAEYIMNKTTPVHNILNLIYTADFVDFRSVAVSFCKWKDFICSSYVFKFSGGFSECCPLFNLQVAVVVRIIKSHQGGQLLLRGCSTGWVLRRYQPSELQN